MTMRTLRAAVAGVAAAPVIGIVLAGIGRRALARIRSIKPSFFRSEDVSVLPLRARLTWIGLWTQCDDSGRAKDNARLIKADIWPLDGVTLRDIEEDLETLAGHGRIVRYEVDGRRYLEIVNWGDHQAIQKPTQSKLPSPSEGRIHSGTPPVALPDTAEMPTAWKGREGNGEEGTRATAEPPPEPPLRCPKHLDDPAPPPCGPCGDARRTRERWERDNATRLAAAPRCRRHRGQLAHNCAPCRSEQKGAA
jgi:hypothetical protein